MYLYIHSAARSGSASFSKKIPPANLARSFVRLLRCIFSLGQPCTYTYTPSLARHAPRTRTKSLRQCHGYSLYYLPEKYPQHCPALLQTGKEAMVLLTIQYDYPDPVLKRPMNRITCKIIGELSCGIYQLSELLKNKRERDMRSLSYKSQAISNKYSPWFSL